MELMGMALALGLGQGLGLGLTGMGMALGFGLPAGCVDPKPTAKSGGGGLWVVAHCLRLCAKAACAHVVFFHAID